MIGEDEDQIILSMPTESSSATGIHNFVGKFLKRGKMHIDGIHEKDENDIYGTRYKKKTIKIKTPLDGSKQEIEWRGKNFKVWRTVEPKVVGCGSSGPKKYDLTYISSNNASIENMKEFIIENHDKNRIQSTKKMISLKIYNGAYWDSKGLIPKRSVDSLFLPKNDIDKIFTVLDEFISEKSEYFRCQIPYKKVILLEGIPGSGKTSLIFVIASYYQRDIYILPLTNETSDYTLLNALSIVRPGSILILEDIDSIFSDSQSQVTLSGITNILDGLSRIDDLWIFLTSNNKNEIPDVVLRDGRIEHIVHFDKIMKDEIVRMVDFIFAEKLSEKEKLQIVSKIHSMSKMKDIAASSCHYFLFEHRNDDVEKILSDIPNISKNKKNSSWGSTLYG